MWAQDPPDPSINLEVHETQCLTTDFIAHEQYPDHYYQQNCLCERPSGKTVIQKLVQVEWIDLQNSKLKLHHFTMLTALDASIMWDL